MFINAFRVDWAFLVDQVGKNPCARQETQVRSPGRDGPLEEGTVTHSSTLAWRIPWTEEPGGLQSMGSQRVGPDRVTNTFTFTYTAKECGFKHFILSREPDDSKPVTPSLGNSIPWCQGSHHRIVAAWFTARTHRGRKQEKSMEVRERSGPAGFAGPERRFAERCWRKRQWHPAPVLLPAKSHGWRSLVGCSPWGC